MFLFIFLLGISAPCRAESIFDPNSLKYRDFHLHAATAYGLSFTGSEILKRKEATLTNQYLIPALAVLALSLGKELLYDKKYDDRDMAGNITGMLLAAGMFYVIEF